VPRGDLVIHTRHARASRSLQTPPSRAFSVSTTTIWLKFSEICAGIRYASGSVFGKLGRVVSPLVLGLVGLALPACGGVSNNDSPVVYSACEPLTVVTASDITPTELAGVSAGIAFWNNRAATRLMLATGQVGQLQLDDKSPLAASVPLYFQEAAAPFHGFYDNRAGLIFINRQLGTEHERAVTVAHELGHAFGLVHVAVGSHPSVMITGNLSVEPTLSDVDSLAALWGRCGP